MYNRKGINMVKQVKENEKRLNKLYKISKSLGKELDKFEKGLKDLKNLNEYYGSEVWFQDKEDFEMNKMPSVKAGVLSEDAVWNLQEELTEIIKKMEEIIKEYYEEDEEE